MLLYTAIALTPFALMIAGAAILWGLAQTRSPAREGPRGVLRGLAAMIGWLLIVIGLFAGVGIAANILGLIVTAVVFAAVLFRYRVSEQRGVLWALMTAAERGIPLASAVRAFAAERHDRLGRRAEDLAEYLEAGLPLALALTRSGHSLPPSVLLAAELGQQTSTLGPSLRQALCRSEESEAALRWAAEKVFYLGMVAIFGLCIDVFLMIKVVPAYIKIFQDFGADLPPATVAIISVSNFMANYWFLFVPLFFLLLFLLLHVTLDYMGVGRILPGWARAWQCTDMRRRHAVAGCGGAAEPSPHGNDAVLAAYYPRREHSLQTRMDGQTHGPGRGLVRFLRPGGVDPPAGGRGLQIRVADRQSGLGPRRDGGQQRATGRLPAPRLVTVAFPVLVLVMGGCVLFFAVGMLCPLVSLIQRLA